MPPFQLVDKPYFMLCEFFTKFGAAALAPANPFEKGLTENFICSLRSIF